jgi:hypothetical protein
MIFLRTTTTKPISLNLSKKGYKKSHPITREYAWPKARYTCVYFVTGTALNAKEKKTSL